MGELEHDCPMCGKRIYHHKGACNSCREKMGVEPASSGCFIATACYGLDSNEVQIFRNWRDTCLSKNKFGRAFIRGYYKVSPPIANFIADKHILKKVVRGCLYPIKEIVS